MLRLVLDPVKDKTLTFTLCPLLTTSATLATRPSLRSSEMWTKPSQRFLEEKQTDRHEILDITTPTTLQTTPSGLKHPVPNGLLVFFYKEHSLLSGLFLKQTFILVSNPRITSCSLVRYQQKRELGWKSTRFIVNVRTYLSPSSCTKHPNCMILVTLPL